MSIFPIAMDYILRNPIFDPVTRKDRKENKQIKFDKI